MALWALLATLVAAVVAVNPVPGSDEILFGYDVVRGVALSQLSPLTYEKGVRWTHPLRPSVTFDVADQIQVHQDAVADIYDAFELTLESWIKEKELTFGLPNMNLGFLGLSVDYEHVREQYLDEMKAFQERRELLGYLQLTPVPNSFAAKELNEHSKTLPATCDNIDDINQYVKFLKAHGTHYISFVRMGGFMHAKAEFLQAVLKEVDEKELTAEINTAWGKFTVGPTFENNRVLQTNHTTVTFTINGGNIYTKYKDMDDWKTTVPENPTAVARTLEPIYDLLESKNTRCFEVGLRQYYADNISPSKVVSAALVTASNPNSDNDIKNLEGYPASGISVEFAEYCKDACKVDGPVIRKVSLLGRSFYGFYPSATPSTVTVDGYKPAALKTVNYECPENTLLVGMKASWTGSCHDKCQKDGFVLSDIDVVCSTPHHTNATRLLTDPEDGAVPFIKTVHLQTKEQGTVEGKCPDDFVVESITVKLTGTCSKYCREEGAIINEIALNCRSLTDFVF